MNHSLRIGVTERGDAGLDLSWHDKLYTVDGGIIITKNLTPACIDKILTAPKPVIVHCTCTGWGGTILEPNVPAHIRQLVHLNDLISKGFPADHCVLRIDPIIPTADGLEKLNNVLNAVKAIHIPVNRVRISLIDEYKHVKARLKDAGLPEIYPGRFYPDANQIADTVSVLKKHPEFEYETCAETKLAQALGISPVGCISKKDIQILFPDENITEQFYTNPQNRGGCCCLSCKMELLTNKKRCPHQCLYCYWRG